MEEHLYLLTTFGTKSAGKMNVVLAQHVLIPSVDRLTLKTMSIRRGIGNKMMKCGDILGLFSNRML